MDYEAKRTGILVQVQTDLNAAEAEYDPLFETTNERNVPMKREIKPMDR